MRNQDDGSQFGSYLEWGNQDVLTSYILYVTYTVPIYDSKFEETSNLFNCYFTFSCNIYFTFSNTYIVIYRGLYLLYSMDL